MHLPGAAPGPFTASPGGPSIDNPYASPAAARASTEEPGTLRPAAIERAFEVGWTAYQDNFAVMLLGGLLVFAFQIVNSIVQAILSNLPEEVIGGDRAIVLEAGATLLGTAVQQVLVAGLFLLGIAACRGEEPQLSVMLRPFQKIVQITLQYLLYLLLGAIPVLILAAPLAVWVWQEGFQPAVVVAGSVAGIVAFLVLLVVTGYYWLALCLLADGRTGLLASFDIGYQLLKTSFWPTMLMTVVSVVICLAGFLACCVGLVFAMPFSSCLFAAVYVIGTGQPILRTGRRP